MDILDKERVELNITLTTIAYNDANNKFDNNSRVQLGYSSDGENFLNKLSVQLLLILAYTFVFCCCFIGNSLVIAVLALNREMQTATNFFLLNLAIADLCVALFCVYQNLSLYLSSEWAFGDLLCRMYHFIHALSYTASVCILVVIAIERYIAVVHPLLSRRMITIARLKYSIICVWIVSALCCLPRFFIYGQVTIEFPYGEIRTETLCVLKQRLYDPKIYDLIYIILCFIIPLVIITVLYTRVCVHLWTCEIPGNSLSVNSSHFQSYNVNTSRKQHKQHKQHLQAIYQSKNGTVCFTTFTPVATPTLNSSNISSFDLLIKRRKKVIKLLVVIVLAFAVFNLPFHARKLIQHYSKTYNVMSQSATIFTISTTLFLYMNSGINPLLYVIFSPKLRTLMFDILLRVFKRRNTNHTNNYLISFNNLHNHSNISNIIGVNHSKISYL